MVNSLTDHSDIKEALVRTIVEAASSQKGILDPEDQEMIVKYHMGQITIQELNAFANAKAKRISDQKDSPQ